MFTAFSMSSMPRRIPMVLRRVITPNKPMENSTAASSKYAWSPIMKLGVAPSLVGPGEVDRPEQPGDEQDGQQLERQHPTGEHRLADRPRQIATHRGSRLRPRRAPDERDQHD